MEGYTLLVQAFMASFIYAQSLSLSLSLAQPPLHPLLFPRLDLRLASEL